MTRRSIFILVTLFVALFIASQATMVNAHDVCGDPPGQWCGAMAAPDNAAPAPAPTVEQGTINRVEDFVSGLPAANSIAIMQAPETFCASVAAPSI